MPVRIIIYDDNADRCDSLSALLQLTPDMQCIGMFPDCSRVEQQVTELQPDIVLMDIDMPNVDGIEGLKRIRAQFSSVKVLMQTVFEQNEKIFDSIRNGATGYILKTESPERILNAIRDVHNGGATMTPSVAVRVLQFFQDTQTVKQQDYQLSIREKEVLKLLSDGNSYKMIAGKLDITYFTVNAHLKKIYEKLHVHSAGEALAVAYREKLV